MLTGIWILNQVKSDWGGAWPPEQMALKIEQADRSLEIWGVTTVRAGRLLSFPPGYAGLNRVHRRCGQPNHIGETMPCHLEGWEWRGNMGALESWRVNNHARRLSARGRFISASCLSHPRRIRIDMKHLQTETRLRAELERAQTELDSARAKCSDLCADGTITYQEAKLIKADVQRRYAEALARFSDFVFRK